MFTTGTGDIDRLQNERLEQIKAIRRLAQRNKINPSDLEDCIKKINADIDEQIRAICPTRQRQQAIAADEEEEEEEKEVPERLVVAKPTRWRSGNGQATTPTSPSKKPRVSEEIEKEDSDSVEWSSTNSDDGDHKVKAISSGSDVDSDDNAAEIVEILQDSGTEMDDDQSRQADENNNQYPDETNNVGDTEGDDENNDSDGDDGDGDGDDDDDSYTSEDHDFDLQRAPDPDIEKEKIRKSKLSMAMQGFLKAKGIKKQGSKIEEAIQRIKAAAFDPEEVKYNGSTFLKGMTYSYKEKDIDVIVGIKRFVSKKKAMCVLIVPFEDTFLGTEEETHVGYVADFKPSSHCQVYDHVSILKLKHFLGRVPGIDTIPEWIYEPQTEGNWNRFGYFLDNAHKIRRMGRREHMRALELFSGAGGMHLGLENAGFTTVAAVDSDNFACATMRMNCRETPVFQEDVMSFLERHNDNQSRDLLGAVDFLLTTSPCQGFSGLNRRGGKNDKRNNDLSLTVLDAVSQFRPTAVIFENVLGMWRRRHVHYLKNIVKGLLKLGYQVRVAELRACDYGSAQKRPRLIIYATHRSAPPPKFPLRSHGSEKGLLPYVTARDVLSGLDAGIDSDGNPLRNMNHATTKRDDAVKLEENSLAPAICASGTPPLHYHHDRCISVRECATLQDFPTTYRISGSSLKDQYRQVGNAVPVELATKLAQAVREILLFEYEEN